MTIGVDRYLHTVTSGMCVSTTPGSIDTKRPALAARGDHVCSYFQGPGCASVSYSARCTGHRRPVKRKPDAAAHMRLHPEVEEGQGRDHNIKYVDANALELAAQRDLPV